MKSVIRREVIQDLKTLSREPGLKEEREIFLLQEFFSSELWENSQVVGVTLSMDFEFNTESLIKKALKSGKKVCIPKTFPKGKMEFFNYNFSEPLVETKFGVLEPLNQQVVTKDMIDLLIVPGVAFNKNGYRTGFGGGFYDRYLMDFKGKTCSLIFDEQLRETIEIENHDIPVSTLFISFSKEEYDGLVLK